MRDRLINWKEKAEESTFFGKRLSNCSSEELLVVIGHLQEELESTTDNFTRTHRGY